MDIQGKKLLILEADLQNTWANHVNLRWFAGLVIRWSELRVLNPRSLKLPWARFARSRGIQNNFTELDDIMEKYELADIPHRISMLRRRVYSTSSCCR